jgi:hypothetical protein
VKTLHLMVSAAMAGLLICAKADAQLQRAVAFGPRNNFSSHANNFSWEGKHGGFHGNGRGSGALRHAQDERVLIVEREVPVIVERETPPPPAAAGNLGTPNTDVPKLPRKPYVIGSSYASLPGSCMKLIDGGVSYYYCSGGEWYRQTGSGRSARYQAVVRKL